MNYSYYPGCSSKSTSIEHEISLKLACEALGINLDELPDWSCCGSNVLKNSNPTLAMSLSLYNLVQAEALNKDLLVPCASCYNLFKRVQQDLNNQETTAKKANQHIALIKGKSFLGTIKIKHTLELFFEKEMIENISKNVSRPLTDLKLVTYYGCLLTRPSSIAIDDNDFPLKMDKIIETLGAIPLDWSYKTECCGAHLTFGQTDIVENLVNNLILQAKKAGADGIVTACPLCQTNLDSRQQCADKMPVFYLTELMAFAMNKQEVNKCFSKHIVNPLPLLNRLK